MQPVAHLIGLSLKLNMRNRMALIYGYAFPLIFLFAFWALYRNDRVPLLLHMGELLTVTVLGGACFGLPTTLVSERERGVWRRYRLTPTPSIAFVVSTLVTRYLLLLSAAVPQLLIALAIGMTFPAHPFDLLVAFTLAAAAFLGIGLIIAMLVDTVPAVQALGQCIFLPMLMIGGVAVPLASLPHWAQHVSAFLPGRYAVEAIQACVSGSGLRGAGFAALALLLIALGGAIAAARMFRWDPRERPTLRRGKAWLLLALGMWLLVGLLAEASGRLSVAPPEERPAVTSYRRASAPPAPAPPKPASPAPAPVSVETPAAPPEAAPSPSWEQVTDKEITEVAYDRLPPDNGLVTPIATTDESPDPAVADQLDRIRAALADWPPGKVADPVQRARNLLIVAAVPDVLQMAGLERFLPVLVYERLRADIPREDLPRILYWVAMHPEEGSDAATRQLGALGLPDAGAPRRTVRTRVMLYSLKLLGRRTGAIVQQ